MEPSMESRSELRSEENAGAVGDRPARPEVDSLLARAGTRPPSNEVRASLAAIQAARAAAELRLQRDSLRVRVLTMTFLAVVAAGTFALAGHLRARRRATAAARAAAAQVSAAPREVPSPPGAASLLTVDSTMGVLSPGPATGVDDLAALTPSASGVRDAALAACREAYDHHRWRAAVDACASAFEASPQDAAVAMKVAQAQHARAHYADAGDWARRALALEDADPEAYVILAHAERRAGHPAAVRNAYHQYLLLAPRGWHASEARAALRGGRASARARSSGHAASARPPEARQPLAEEIPLRE
jgi:hypothetical protein